MVEIDLMFQLAPSEYCKEDDEEHDSDSNNNNNWEYDDA